jgi:glycosyltransferase involved in cell wall biosynthesis
MIGLQILHVATSLAAAEAGDALTMISWLQANGHRATLAAGGEGELPGVEVIRYRASTAAWWLGGKKDLLAQAAAWNPDLIHLHGLAALPAARALAKRLALPVLVSVDHAVAPYAARGLREPNVSWVLVPTDAHRAHFVGRVRVSRDHVSVLPFAVDAARCAACAPRIPDGELVVGAMIDSAEPSAGLSCLLGAVAVLRRDEMPVRVAIGTPAAPDEELGEAIAEAVAAVNGASWTVVSGVRRALELIERCDVLVHPATVDRSPAAVIEAMACARTVVATGVGGMPELLRDGHTGLLVQPGDPTALATAISALVRSPEQRQQLAANAAAFATERYDIGVVGPAVVELYRAAISARQNSSAKAEGSRAYQRRVSDPSGG